MKIRASIVWFVLITVAFIALLVWFHNRTRTTQTMAALSSTNAPASTVLSQNQSIGSPIHSDTVPVSQTATTNTLSPQPPDSKEQQMRTSLAEMNDQDIVLYGKVIDQSDAPVAGATVTGAVQVNNGTRVGSDKVSVVTDDNGLFTISGYKGKALGIWITKPGYVMATTTTRFVYSLLWPASQRYIPDAGNPAIIKIWKLQGAEPLVNINQDFKIPFTSAPISFDLLTGKIVQSGGDLNITVNRPTGEISEQNPQKWSIALEVPTGGFIETSDKESAVTFVAPDSGYQSSGSFENNNGPTLIDQALFVESRNGQIYCKLRLLFTINKAPNGLMDVSFSGIANINGSRNWEATAPQ